MGGSARSRRAERRARANVATSPAQDVPNKREETSSSPSAASAAPTTSGVSTRRSRSARSRPSTPIEPEQATSPPPSNKQQRETKPATIGVTTRRSARSRPASPTTDDDEPPPQQTAVTTRRQKQARKPTKAPVPTTTTTTRAKRRKSKTGLTTETGGEAGEDTSNSSKQGGKVGSSRDGDVAPSPKRAATRSSKASPEQAANSTSSEQSKGRRNTRSGDDPSQGSVLPKKRKRTPTLKARQLQADKAEKEQQSNSIQTSKVVTENGGDARATDKKGSRASKRANKGNAPEPTASTPESDAKSSEVPRKGGSPTKVEDDNGCRGEDRGNAVESERIRDSGNKDEARISHEQKGDGSNPTQSTKSRDGISLPLSQSTRPPPTTERKVISELSKSSLSEKDASSSNREEGTTIERQRISQSEDAAGDVDVKEPSYAIVQNDDVGKPASLETGKANVAKRISKGKEDEGKSVSPTVPDEGSSHEVNREGKEDGGKSKPEPKSTERVSDAENKTPKGREDDNGKPKSLVPKPTERGSDTAKRKPQRKGADERPKSPFVLKPAPSGTDSVIRNPQGKEEDEKPKSPLLPQPAPSGTDSVNRISQGKEDDGKPKSPLLPKTAPSGTDSVKRIYQGKEDDGKAKHLLVPKTAHSCTDKVKRISQGKEDDGKPKHLLVPKTAPSGTDKVKRISQGKEDDGKPKSPSVPKAADFVTDNALRISHGKDKHGTPLQKPSEGDMDEAKRLCQGKDDDGKPSTQPNEDAPESVKRTRQARDDGGADQVMAMPQPSDGDCKPNKASQLRPIGDASGEVKRIAQAQDGEVKQGEDCPDATGISQGSFDNGTPKSRPNNDCSNQVKRIPPEKGDDGKPGENGSDQVKTVPRHDDGKAKSYLPRPGEDGPDEVKRIAQAKDGDVTPGEHAADGTTRITQGENDEGKPKSPMPKPSEDGFDEAKKMPEGKDDDGKSTPPSIPNPAENDAAKRIPKGEAEGGKPVPPMVCKPGGEGISDGNSEVITPSQHEEDNPVPQSSNVSKSTTDLETDPGISKDDNAECGLDDEKEIDQAGGQASKSDVPAASVESATVGAFGEGLPVWNKKEKDASKSDMRKTVGVEQTTSVAMSSKDSADVLLKASKEPPTKVAGTAGTAELKSPENVEARPRRDSRDCQAGTVVADSFSRDNVAASGVETLASEQKELEEDATLKEEITLRDSAGTPADVDVLGDISAETTLSSSQQMDQETQAEDDKKETPLGKEEAEKPTATDVGTGRSAQLVDISENTNRAVPSQTASGATPTLVADDEKGTENAARQLDEHEALVGSAPPGQRSQTSRAVVRETAATPPSKHANNVMTSSKEGAGTSTARKTDMSERRTVAKGNSSDTLDQAARPLSPSTEANLTPKLSPSPATDPHRPGTNSEAPVPRSADVINLSLHDQNKDTSISSVDLTKHDATNSRLLDISGRSSQTCDRKELETKELVVKLAASSSCSAEDGGNAGLSSSQVENVSLERGNGGPSDSPNEDDNGRVQQEIKDDGDTGASSRQEDGVGSTKPELEPGSSEDPQRVNVPEDEKISSPQQELVGNHVVGDALRNQKGDLVGESGPSGGIPSVSAALAVATADSSPPATDKPTSGAARNTIVVPDVTLPMTGDKSIVNVDGGTITKSGMAFDGVDNRGVANENHEQAKKSLAQMPAPVDSASVTSVDAKPGDSIPTVTDRKSEHNDPGAQVENKHSTHISSLLATHGEPTAAEVTDDKGDASSADTKESASVVPPDVEEGKKAAMSVPVATEITVSSKPPSQSGMESHDVSPVERGSRSVSLDETAEAVTQSGLSGNDSVGKQAPQRAGELPEAEIRPALEAADAQKTADALKGELREPAAEDSNRIILLETAKVGKSGASEPSDVEARKGAGMPVSTEPPASVLDENKDAQDRKLVEDKGTTNSDLPVSTSASSSKGVTVSHSILATVDSGSIGNVSSSINQEEQASDTAGLQKPSSEPIAKGDAIAEEASKSSPEEVKEKPTIVLARPRGKQIKSDAIAVQPAELSMAAPDGTAEVGVPAVNQKDVGSDPGADVLANTVGRESVSKSALPDGMNLNLDKPKTLSIEVTANRASVHEAGTEEVALTRLFGTVERSQPITDANSTRLPSNLGAKVSTSKEENLRNSVSGAESNGPELIKMQKSAAVSSSSQKTYLEQKPLPGPQVIQSTKSHSPEIVKPVDVPTPLSSAPNLQAEPKTVSTVAVTAPAPSSAPNSTKTFIPDERKSNLVGESPSQVGERLGHSESVGPDRAAKDKPKESKVPPDAATMVADNLSKGALKPAELPEAPSDECNEMLKPKLLTSAMTRIPALDYSSIPLRFQRFEDQSIQGAAVQKPGRSLRLAKVALYAAAMKVHRGENAERLFSNYWTAVIRYIHGYQQVKSRRRLRWLEETRGTMDAFLTTRRLRRLHNSLMIGVLERASGSMSVDASIDNLPLSWKERAREKAPTPTPSSALMAERQRVTSSLGFDSGIWVHSGDVDEPPTNDRLLAGMPSFPWDPIPHAAHRLVKRSSALVPGALSIDPTVRRLVTEAGFKCSEQGIWLLVVGVRQYLTTVLKDIIETKTAVSDENQLVLMPRRLTIAREASGTKRKATTAALPSPVPPLKPKVQPLPSGKRRCISPLDLATYIMGTPCGESLGGTESRTSFETCLNSSQVRFTQPQGLEPVQRFISTGLAKACLPAAKEEAKAFVPPTKATAIRVKQPETKARATKASRARQTKSSKAAKQPQGKPGKQASKLLAKKALAAKAEPKLQTAGTVPAKETTPTKPRAPVVRRSPVSGGLGRGAKNLRRMYQANQQNSPTPKDAVVAVPKAGQTPSQPPTTVTVAPAPAVVPTVASIHATKTAKSLPPVLPKGQPGEAQAGTPVTLPQPAPAAVAVQPMPPQTRPLSRGGGTSGGRGFGVKNLAAMRQRSTVSDDGTTNDSKSGS